MWRKDVWMERWWGMRVRGRRWMWGARGGECWTVVKYAILVELRMIDQIWSGCDVRFVVDAEVGA